MADIHPLKKTTGKDQTPWHSYWYLIPLYELKFKVKRGVHCCLPLSNGATIVKGRRTGNCGLPCNGGSEGPNLVRQSRGLVWASSQVTEFFSCPRRLTRQAVTLSGEQVIGAQGSLPGSV